MQLLEKQDKKSNLIRKIKDNIIYKSRKYLKFAYKIGDESAFRCLANQCVGATTTALTSKWSRQMGWHWTGDGHGWSGKVRSGKEQSCTRFIYIPSTLKADADGNGR